MDYEKAYKEALERALKLRVQNPFDTVSQMMEYVFSELKESKEEWIEKIRAEIITYLKNRQIISIPEHDAVATWLSWIENQGKQEPVDNVVPKFHEGDWIVTDKNHIWLIDKDCSTTGYSYRLISQNGKVEVGDYNIVDEHARLWTIEDAKDGDILANKASDAILIFKNIQDNYRFSSYCDYFANTFRENQFSQWASSAFIPATKE